MRTTTIATVLLLTGCGWGPKAVIEESGKQASAVEKPEPAPRAEDNRACLPFSVDVLRGAASPVFPRTGWKYQPTEYLGLENISLPITGFVESQATYSISGPLEDKAGDCVEEAEIYVNINAPGDFGPAQNRLLDATQAWFRNTGVAEPNGLQAAISAREDFHGDVDRLTIDFTAEHFVDGSGVRQPDGSNFKTWMLLLKITRAEQ